MMAFGAAAALALILGIGAWRAVDMVSSLSAHADQAAYLSSVEARLEALRAKAGDAENEHRAYLQTPDAVRLKAFNDAVAAIQGQFDELLKLTTQDPRLHANLRDAKELTDKKAESIRDAMDAGRNGQVTNAVTPVGQGGMGPTVKGAIEPLQKRLEAAAAHSRGRPRDIASFTGYWLLATWLLAAAVGIAIAVLAVRQGRAVGRLDRRLRRESIHDNLTGLPNNAYLEEWLSRSLSRASRTGSKVGLVYVDINNFKQVNHALGYGEGDRVLVEIAEKLSHMTRKSDFVARVRNDSFALVMPDVTDIQQVESAMSRFAALSVVRASITIKTTVGAAVFPEDAETPDNLIRLSRAAMYRNRQTRRAA